MIKELNIHFISIIVILFFSFQNAPSKKNSISKNNQEIYKFVILKKNDWEYLNKFTIKSNLSVSLVDYKSNKDVIQYVQYESERQRLTNEQKEKLKEVLSKYD